MRIVLTGLLGFIAVACATSDPAPVRDVAGAAEPWSEPDYVVSLPAQQLSPGQCGVFLFEARAPNRFVMFEDEAARSSKIVHAGEVHEIRFADQPGAFLPGEEFRRVYPAQDGSLSFVLSGRVGENTGGGRRLEGVILTVRQPDGTRTVRPLAGVRRCMDG